MRWAACLFVAWDTQAADVPPPPKALETVAAYSRAVASEDFDALARLSHPILVLRAGGRVPYREQMKDAFAEMHRAGAVLEAEVRGKPTAVFESGRTRAFAVPVLRKTERFVTPLAYVVISYDAGATWTVFDLLCTDNRWLKAALPTYEGVPDLLPVHPDVPKSVEEAIRVPGQ
jgi:hypothetical protein